MSGQRLLVVDDSEMNRDALSRRLRGRGFAVEQAGHGREVLPMVQEQGFDLILLDINMPDVDGIQVLRALRAQYSMVELPVMMLSAKDDSTVMVEAFRLGANDYVTKPIDFEVTLARIQALLARRSLEGHPGGAGPAPPPPAASEEPESESLTMTNNEAPVEGDIPIGTRLGSYTIVGVLGRGGMGVVYECQDKDLQRLAAVKVLHRKYSVDTQWATRFRREAQAAARVEHPNVVGIYQIGMWREHHYLAMPLIKGRSAAAVVREQGALPWREATSLIEQACRGLVAAHDRGVLHRDLKPDNIMVGTDRTVRLLDFGLATVGEGPVDERLTQPGTLMGSPHFMSPEQCRGESVDARSDIYQLGASYYNLLTGRFPYAQYRYPLDLLNAHISDPVPDPSQVAADLPGGCIQVVQKAMSKDPQDRYESARALLADLDKLLGGLMDVLELFRQGGPERELVVRISRLSNPDVFRRLAEQLRGEPEKTRCYAMEVFGVAGNPEALETMTAFYRDESPAVRIAALMALDRLGGDPAETPQVATLLRQDRSSLVRAAAARALVATRRPDARQVLEEVLRDPQLPDEVRDEITEGLRKFKA